LLSAFAGAGVLSVADVQVATRLGRLVGEHDEAVLLAAALTVRGTRQGSVAFDLATAAESIAADGEATVAEPLPWPPPDSWVARCAGSPLVSSGDDEPLRPLRRSGARLWLTRYWNQEALVAAEIGARAAERPDDLDADVLAADLDHLFPRDEDRDQRAAAAIAAGARVAVVAGGPGTGKTTTIARLVTALWRQRPALRIALAAPTGKAAARLQEAVHGASENLSATDRERLAGLSASTLHRLLRPRPGRTGRFVHDRGNRLPYDVVIVDESSMVPLTMMARLLDALPRTARLVLVGDPDQLASVEAGAVLGDLVPGGRESPLRDSVAVLTRVRRFGEASPIGELADRVRAGDADGVLGLLQDSDAAIEFHETPDDAPLSAAAHEVLRSLTDHEVRLAAAARAGDLESALDLLDERRLLCAHRTGPRGERFWSDAIERWLAADDPTAGAALGGHHAGQPLLVTANDYDNGLYNGDTGVVVRRGSELAAAFRRAAGVVLVPLARLGDVRPLHALTVHRAQGSQFRSVVVLLPAADSPLATRQTFYTAVTRATTSVTVIGSPEAVRACVERPVTRATGLRERLATGVA
jgi:exodeoxyribonuclease V alpha subunit